MRDKHPTPKVLSSITLAVVLLLGSAVTLTAWQLHGHGSAPPQTASTSHAVAGKATTRAAVQPIQYHGQAGKTALELLKQHAQVVTKDSSYGEYVDSINGVTGGTNGKYWTFYVNGAQAQVGAGAYTTQDSDSITWKFE